MKQVKEAINADSYSKKGEVFTLRRGFFYKFEKTEENLVEDILEAIPTAKIIDSGEYYTAFRGGASIANQSHWWVKFSVK